MHFSNLSVGHRGKWVIDGSSLGGHGEEGGDAQRHPGGNGLNRN